ncbi:hypothetical protein DPX16_5962 [Anabarilius grahami]|uniref:Uncharacterized protein n=1 Tax=Anabarilius grahami TaxID=495550 RepID=A0A3N0Z0J9_ANAGA|nr:hypothetical protein DPX16_5962 [Anabarilius grahami]
MLLVFTFITCLAISGTCFGTSSLRNVMLISVNKPSGAAVSKTVKMGENITFLDTTPGLGNVRRVSLQKCENGTGDIFRYCSPEEEICGCFNISSERFSIQINNASICVTLLEAKASDEDCYVFSVTDECSKVNKTKINVKVYGRVLSRISKLPKMARALASLIVKVVISMCPRNVISTRRSVQATVLIDNLQSLPSANMKTKPKLGHFMQLRNPGQDFQDRTICAIRPGRMAHMKKKNNSDDRREDPKEFIPLTSHINGGKPDTDESLEIVDETSLWMGNENLRSKDLNHGA